MTWKKEMEMEETRETGGEGGGGNRGGGRGGREGTENPCFEAKTTMRIFFLSLT